jgi:hypothetical protein
MHRSVQKSHNSFSKKDSTTHDTNGYPQSKQFYSSSYGFYKNIPAALSKSTTSGIKAELR